MMSIALVNFSIEISNVRFSVGLFQRIMLFQSVRQQYSYIATSAITLAFTYALTTLVLPKLAEKGFGSHLLILALFPLLAPLPLVFGVLPATFFVTSHSQTVMNKALQFLDREITGLGYKKKPDDAHRYIPLTPRWLSWEENEICIKRRGDEIALCGPIFTLRSLQQRLKSDLAKLS
jgi:hypothetical protein